MEKVDEASELASLASSADSEAARPSSFSAESTQPRASSPVTGSAATSGSPAPPKDSAGS